MTEKLSVEQKLRDAGLKATRQRRALAGLLLNAGDRHISADHLHMEACAMGISVSLATVYNTLKQLTKVGLLREVAVEGSRNFFDTNVSDHGHFYIQGEGKLLDMNMEGVRVLGLPLAPDGTYIDRIDVVVRVRKNQS